MATPPKDSPRKQKIDKIVEDMTDELRQQYQELCKLWENRTGKELTDHHAIGQLVAAIDDDEGTYGKRAVAKLAQALGLNRATLYDYAAVARYWSTEEITKVRERKGFMGRSLSWSHLVELSRVKKKSEREKLFVQALVEGLTVRELAGRVKEHLPSKTDSLPAGKAVLKDLQKMADNSELLLKKSREQTRKLCERLKGLDPLELTRAHLVVLQRFIKTLKELKTICEDHPLMLWESKEKVYAAMNPAVAGDSNETEGAATSDEKRPEQGNPATAANNNGTAQPAPRNGRKRKGQQAA
jgi:hypothetical protein